MAKASVLTGTVQGAKPDTVKTELYFTDVTVFPGVEQHEKDPLKANADVSQTTATDVKAVTNPKPTAP